MAASVAKINNGVRRLVVEGEVDITNLDGLKQPLQELLSSETVSKDLVIDFSGTQYIDSAVLEVVIKAWHRLSAEGGRLQIITHKGSQPSRVLHTCQFQTIIDIREINGAEAESLP